MFGFGMHYLHEVITTKKGTIVLLDIADTFDAGIESAYAILDKESFDKWWNDYMVCDSDDCDTNWTLEDVEEYGEDEADAFSGWTVVSSHHRSVEAAEKKLLAAVKKL